MDDAPPEHPNETWETSILKQDLLLQTELVSKLARNLEHGMDFPSETPQKLCKLIAGTATILGKYLPNTPPEQLQHVDTFLHTIAEDLRFAERSRMTETPWSMVQSTEAFLKKHAGDKCHFIIRPQWSYNYGIVGEFIGAYEMTMKGFPWIPLTEWYKGICLREDDCIYCISFPRVDRLNALSHACWGHEIGHIFADKWMLKKFDSLWQDEEQSVKDAIKKAVLENPLRVDPLFKETAIRQITAERTNEAMQFARQGLTELICDAFGIHLLGTAALASLCEFSVRFYPDESPVGCGGYPPWRYRLRLMLKACQSDLAAVPACVAAAGCDSGVFEPFLEWISQIATFVGVETDRDEIQGDPITREAYRVIETHWEKIRVEALALLSPAKGVVPYRLCDKVGIVADLVGKLQRNTPPNECGIWPQTVAADLEDILNAAWVYKTLMTRSDPQWGSPEDYDRLFRLVLKGIEAGFVHSSFGPQLKD